MVPDLIYGSSTSQAPPRLERDRSIQSGLRELWQITGSQLHFHGMNPVNDANLEGIFTDSGGTMFDSPRQSVRDLFSETFSKSQIQVRSLI